MFFLEVTRSVIFISTDDTRFRFLTPLPSVNINIKEKISNLSSYVHGFREILRFSRYEKKTKKFRFKYTSGLIQFRKFTNNVNLSVKFTGRP